MIGFLTSVAVASSGGNGPPPPVIHAFPGLDGATGVPVDARFPVYASVSEGHEVVLTGPGGVELPTWRVDRDEDWFFYAPFLALQPETTYTVTFTRRAEVESATFTTGDDVAPAPEMPEILALVDLGIEERSAGCEIETWQMLTAELALTPPDAWSWVYLRDSEAGVRGASTDRELLDPGVDGLDFYHQRRVGGGVSASEWGCFVAVVENAAGATATTDEQCVGGADPTGTGTTFETPPASEDEERGCSTAPAPGGALALGVVPLVLGGRVSRRGRRGISGSQETV